MGERAPRPAPPAEPKLEPSAPPRGSVPHFDQIQRSFGRHDISNVAVRTASRDAEALGARAFANGETVAFAESPDLRTAAHELAHVVQQRAGVVSHAIDQGPHDRWETHADAVAEAVVRGESAEPLLDQLGSGTPVVAIQRKASSSPAPGYANANRAHILSAIDDRVGALVLPQPHPRLHWTSRDEARHALVNAIRLYVERVPNFALARLEELAYPANLAEIIEQALVAPGGIGWVPQVGLAIAVAFDAPLLMSIQRMGMRLRVQLDRNPEIPAATTLVASSPLDGVVAEVLVQRGVVAQSDLLHRTPTHGDTPGSPFASGAHDVKFGWQGAIDPKLWNWIRVTSPANPTVEDVARTPLGGHEMAGSELAQRIVASPPLFQIPIETARLIPDAWDRAPAATKIEIENGHVPRVPDASELADTKLTDEMALAQTPKSTDRNAEFAVGRVWVQLTYLKRRLEAWVPVGLDGVISYVQRHRADTTSAHRFAPVFAAQTHRLTQIADDIKPLTEALDAHGAKRNDPAIAPIVRTLAAYTLAASVSHLPIQATISYAAAQQQRALLPITQLEPQLHALGEVIAAEGPGSHDDAARLAALTERAADLKIRASRGDGMDSDAVDELAADASLLTAQARLKGLEYTLAEIGVRADEVGYTKELWQNGLPTIRALPAHVVTAIAGWRRNLALAQTPPKPTSHESVARQRATWKQGVANTVSAEINDFGKTAQIDRWLSYASKVITDEKLNNLIKSIAVQIGLSLLVFQAGTALLGAIRGAALAGTIAMEIRGASLLYKAGELALHAALATGVQAATGSEVSIKTFAENALGMVIANGMMKPFAALLEDSAAVEREVVASASKWRLAARGAGKAATVGAGIALETATGVASSGLAHALLESGEMSTASQEEWATQAISIVVSRLVHQRTARMQQRLADIVRLHGDARFSALAEKAASLHARTAPGKTPPALDTATELYKLAVAEHAAVGSLPATNPHRIASDSELARLTDPEYADVSLRLAGLSEIVPSQFDGTPKQITNALHALEAMGFKPRVDRGAHQVTVTIGNRVIEIRELGGGEQRTQSQKLDPYAAPAPKNQSGKLDPNAPPTPKRSGPGRVGGADKTARDVAKSPPTKTAKEVLSRRAKEIAPPNATTDALATIERVLALDEVEGTRLVREYGHELTDYLKYNPLEKLSVLEKTLAKERNQIRDRVEGFYTGVNPTKPPKGWHFTDTLTPAKNDPNTMVLETDVVGPNNSTGYFERGYNPRTKVIELRMAFLRLGGQEILLPSKISKQGNEVEMLGEGKGSPTVQYITAYQLRKLGVPFGGRGGSAVEKIHMSDIQNVETIIHLHWLQKHVGGAVHDLVAHTASVKYADTTAVQTGYERVGAPVVTKGEMAPINELLSFQEGESWVDAGDGSVARRNEHQAILDKYGFTRETPMFMKFDIDFHVKGTR